MTITLDELYKWPIKSAKEREEHYYCKFLAAKINSRQEAAYLGLWRKWRKQVEVLEEALAQAKYSQHVEQLANELESRRSNA